MIYLDYAATTPCLEEVVAAMLPFFRDDFANASSVDHSLGVAARQAVESARQSVADLVGAQPEDVIFTSGSTEANNLAMSTTRRVLTTRLEHPSVLDAFMARRRADDGFLLTDKHGMAVHDALREQLNGCPRPTLVSVIATNNETGVEQDIEALQRLTYDAGALLHIDGTQAILTRSIPLRKLRIAAMSFSAHKMYGPKGVGALVAYPGLRSELAPIMRGGGHERGLRSGTLNVPLIVGFGTAAQISRRERLNRRRELLTRRQAFLKTLRSVYDGNLIETVPERQASPHILSLRLEGTNSRALLGALRNNVAFSLASACSTTKSEPSHVLTALGLEKRQIAEIFRVSFSHELKLDEVKSSAQQIGLAATALSRLSVPA